MLAALRGAARRAAAERRLRRHVQPAQGVHHHDVASRRRARPTFLAPALMTRWLAGRSVDSARALLARRQFETYANELRYANPFPDTADAAAVDEGAHVPAAVRRLGEHLSVHARRSGEDESADAVQRNVAGSAPYVVDAYEVPGAFTKGGAAFMLERVQDGRQVSSAARAGSSATTRAASTRRSSSPTCSARYADRLHGAVAQVPRRRRRSRATRTCKDAAAEARGLERQSVAAARALLDRVAEHGGRAARRRGDVPAGAARHAADGDGQVDRREERDRTSTRCSRSSRRSIRRRTRRARRPKQAAGQAAEQRDRARAPRRVRSRRASTSISRATCTRSCRT